MTRNWALRLYRWRIVASAALVAGALILGARAKEIDVQYVDDGARRVLQTHATDTNPLCA